MGHDGQDLLNERQQHFLGKEVDTQVPIAKMISEGKAAEESNETTENLYEPSIFNLVSSLNGQPSYDISSFDSRAPPEERVAKVAVSNSEKYKREALKAV